MHGAGATVLLSDAKLENISNMGTAFMLVCGGRDSNIMSLWLYSFFGCEGQAQLLNEFRLKSRRLVWIVFHARCWGSSLAL